MKKGRPVLAAYVDTGALDVSCTHCGATPGAWCLTDDGRARRVPCVDRAAAGVGTGDGKPYAPRDFSEPAHPAGPHSIGRCAYRGHVVHQVGEPQ